MQELGYISNNHNFDNLDKSIGDDRQLSNEEKGFIVNTITNFKLENKNKTLYGQKVEYNNKEALRLLSLAGEIMVDKKTADNFNDNISSYLPGIPLSSKFGVIGGATGNLYGWERLYNDLVKFKDK